MNTLQSLVLPNLEVQATEDMYVRLDSRVWADMRARTLHFAAGGVASSDTFFNGFTVDCWKRHCRLAALALRLNGRGRFVVSLGLHRPQCASVWLDERTLSLDGTTPLDWPVDAWSGLSAGMLFVRWRALEDGALTACDFVTPDAPVQDIRLGIVITHFNRQAQVLPAIHRIRRDVLDAPQWQGRISLTVIDNSRNLGLADGPGLEVVPNRNLGGTGGFVRGLLRLIDEKRCSHALFMDDDASCETASITRSHALLSYAHTPKLSVAGALLRESVPWHLLEKGARFDGRVEPLCAGLDMRQIADLLRAEREQVLPAYGAWWFFMFPIAAVEHWPFPFFVRGDDILFGLRNDFRITTLNGVACMGEDFSLKHSPLTAYLDARYHLVLALATGGKARADVSWVASRLFAKALTSYQYTSARAVTLAMRHVLEGPDFFRRNLDMQAIRAEIGGLRPTEKLVPIERASMPLRGDRRGRESRSRRWLRALTLQGFLLPGWLLYDRTTVQEKAFHGRASAVFRYRRVLYEHSSTGTGFLAEYDRPRFFQEVRVFIATFARLLWRLSELASEYARDTRTMGSEPFWRDVYAEELAPPAARPRHDDRSPSGQSNDLRAKAAVPARRHAESVEPALEPLSPQASAQATT
ncbi:MAG: glycosyltransferase family 2 protein [Rhizobacter sp.]|nr:glycosyltransferase family 2 protein [Rhizobacter sp.]